jgi:hypothetical protein
MKEDNLRLSIVSKAQKIDDKLGTEKYTIKCIEFE